MERRTIYNYTTIYMEKTIIMNEELKEYVKSEIIPMYDNFDKAHRRDHAKTVIARSLELAKHYDVDINMVYAAAAYHDTGLCEGREFHHIASGRIIRADKELHKWFSDNEIEIIAEAAEDHRASSDHEPRTIYGKILAEADRLIDGETIVQRAVQFGVSRHPEKTKEEQWERFLKHINEKYAEGGYLKLWIPESQNAKRLEDFRKVIKDKLELRALFDKFYENETIPGKELTRRG